MPLLGQSSGGFNESTSALRILHIGVRNSVGVLSDDSFTQTNPPAVATDVSTQVDQTVLGVLGGSVCFTRPDSGSNRTGGPGSNDTQTTIAGDNSLLIGYSVLGCFISDATGLPYSNLPGVASGKGPYVSAQGVYGNALFETFLIADSADAVNSPAGNTITYTPGQRLMASRNGYLMPTEVIGDDGGIDQTDVVAMSAESFVKGLNGSSTLIGVVKMPPDAVQNEIVYDQRI